MITAAEMRGDNIHTHTHMSYDTV